MVGECEQTLEGHHSGVNSADFASTSEDKSVRVWSVVTGECEQKLEDISKATAQPEPGESELVFFFQGDVRSGDAA